jgi:prepilin-type N-terminal cleavage/methylation domain-containing protein
VNRYRRSAFSLIELIVVLLIMGSVGSVIVACFMGGVRAYERARDFGRGETDAYLAFEMMERDLKNAVAVPGVPFMGEASFMQFATKELRRIPTGGMGMDVAMIRYWQGQGDGVVREASVLGESAQTESGGGESVFVGAVAMRLSFSAGGGDGALSPWDEAWQSESNLPQQVRIQFSGGSLGATRLERTIALPVAGE